MIVKEVEGGGECVVEGLSRRLGKLRWRALIALDAEEDLKIIDRYFDVNKQSESQLAS